MADSRFTLTELDELPDDLRERIGEIAGKSGFVPNIFRAVGHRPAELRAFLDYHDALMERTEGLSKAERELVVVATSAANFCTYCIVAHGALLRIRSKDSQLADQVAANPWQARLDPRARRVQPPRAPYRPAAERRVLPHGPGAAKLRPVRRALVPGQGCSPSQDQRGMVRFSGTSSALS
jgi:AhpD family alkylhydroperoxidase